jgi:hypothetical protein
VEELRRPIGATLRADGPPAKTSHQSGPILKDDESQRKRSTLIIRFTFVLGTVGVLLAYIVHFVPQNLARQTLLKRDWSHARYDDDAFSHCMNVVPCLERKQLAERLKAVTDWTRIVAGDPLLNDCMAYSPCLEASTRTTHIAVRGLSVAHTLYYGAVDFGSKGTKAALFSLQKDTCPKRLPWADSDLCDIYERVINSSLVSSMRDDQFTDAGIQSAVAEVKELLDQMKAAARESELPAVKYFVVGSGGVAKAKNKGALAASVKEATGINMDFIDAKREGYFGLRSTVPREILEVSLYVDIGNRKTKLACLVGGSGVESFRSAEIEYDSVSWRNRGAEKNSGELKAGIQQLLREEIKPAYERESMEVPCLRSRE